MAIFPISALGVNVSIHQCKHNGTTHISFFDSHKNNEYSCCSSHRIIEQSKKSGSSSQYSKSKTGKKSMFNCGSCIKKKSKLIKKDNISKKSSCSKSINFGKDNSTCCKDSFLKFKIKSSFNSISHFKLISSNHFSYSDFVLSHLLYNYKPVNIAFKKVQYPLKEPISGIISFIHFTSDEGSDSDIPSNIYC
ncbi:MAG: hypothetical protein HW421_1545 [Ignavibacteria bacterium]|nr:hypothetical protein [Ignavibacteria bacterium]